MLTYIRDEIGTLPEGIPRKMSGGHVVITIDGPAGTGKSTAARKLAQLLGFSFLDTGAMYRAIAWGCLQQGMDLTRHDLVTNFARQADLQFEDQTIRLNGQDVTQAIRLPQVTLVASQVAAIEGVREQMVALQRRAAEGQNIVTEGRDQGTIVFPEAPCKFFLTASPLERAKRREAQLRSSGQSVPLEEILEQQQLRDERDENRTIAPLRPAADATIVDTTSTSLEEVIDYLQRVVMTKTSSPRTTA